MTFWSNHTRSCLRALNIFLHVEKSICKDRFIARCSISSRFSNPKNSSATYDRWPTCGSPKNANAGQKYRGYQSGNFDDLWHSRRLLLNGRFFCFLKIIKQRWIVLFRQTFTFFAILFVVLAHYVLCIIHFFSAFQTILNETIGLGRFGCG